jgi:hypothetical protein
VRWTFETIGLLEGRIEGDAFFQTYSIHILRIVVDCRRCRVGEPSIHHCCFLSLVFQLGTNQALNQFCEKEFSGYANDDEPL